MHAPAPETWTVQASDTSVVVLTIPGALDRTRVFDVDVQLRIRVPVDTGACLPEFSLSLEIDGAQQWRRTTQGCAPGASDTLEYHCRLTLPPGRDARLRARARPGPCALQSLSLSASEERA